MSHTTTLRGVQIRDIAALSSAVADLKAKGVNCDLISNARPRMYYGNQHGVCDYVLKLPNSQYDVGFDRQADGSYAPVFDEWAGSVAGQIGATCPMPTSAEGKVQRQIGQLLQNYAKHAAINAAVAQGHTVESCTQDEEGNLNLVLAVM